MVMKDTVKGEMIGHTQPDDEELVHAFQSGDERAFDVLVKRYQERIRLLCLRYLADLQEADDAAQEVFIRVYQHLGDFMPRARFSTWLYRVAVNDCLNRLRARRRRQWMQPFSRVSEAALQAKSEASNPAVDLERREEHAKVRTALARLSDDQRTAILLHRYEGLSYKEIAEVMNCSVSAVEARLHRAKIKLADWLSEKN